jgi:hypothetical protein
MIRAVTIRSFKLFEELTLQLNGMNMVLAGPYAAFKHPVRGLTLSQRRAACEGSLTQKTPVCQKQDISYLEPPEHDK